MGAPGARAGRSVLDRLDETVDAELRVDADEEVDVVGHGLELHELGTRFLADLRDDL